MFADMQTVTEMSIRDGVRVCDIVGYSALHVPDHSMHLAVRQIIDIIKEHARRIDTFDDTELSFSISEAIAYYVRIELTREDHLLNLLQDELKKHSGTRNGVNTSVHFDRSTKTVTIRARRA